MANIPSLSTIKRVSKFEAQDRTTFDSAKDARIHDLGLTLRAALIEEGYRDESGAIKQLCLTMAKKHNKFRKIYAALNLAQNMKS
jgi:hypothetical protein